MDAKVTQVHKRPVSLFIPYRKDGGKILVYLQRRDKDAKRLPDWFGFFGGGIESHETPERAFLREIQEELNHTPINYRYLGEFKKAWVYISEVPSDFESKIKILEGQYGKWFSEEEALQEPLLREMDKEILRALYALP